MEECLFSPSTLEDSDEDPDYTLLSQEMDTSSDEDELLQMKRGCRDGDDEGMEDDSEASSEFEVVPTWLLPAKRQRATTSTQSGSAA